MRRSLTWLAAGLAALLPAAPAAAAQIAQPAQVDAEAEAARTARNLAKTHEVARCLVRDFRLLVAPILEHSPGSDSEQMGISQLRRRGLRCVESVSNLKNGAAFIASWDIAAPALRGALAEALYEADFSGPARVRPRELARVAPVGRRAPEAGPAGEDPGGVRRFAACAVRSAPDDSGALLAMGPGSAAETEAVRRLVRDFDGCFPTDVRGSINVPTVRSLVAEALYRHRSALARGEPPEPGEKVARHSDSRSGAVVIVPASAAANGAAEAAGGYVAEDVRKLVELSRCIAGRRPADAQELLTMDYREAAYDRMAKWVTGRSMACVPRGKLRFSRLLFAGGLAEEMLARPGGGLPAEPSTGGPGDEPRDGDITERIGSCLVRTQPTAVAKLLATAPASAEEGRVVRDLTPYIAGCVAPGKTARISQPSLRAIAALTAYRLVQQQSGAPSPGRN